MIREPAFAAVELGAESGRVMQNMELTEPSHKAETLLTHWLEDHAWPSVHPKTYDSYALNLKCVLLVSGV